MSEKKSTKKMGRPKLPKGHAKGQIRPVRFSDSDLKLFNKIAAKSEHKTLSSWIRYTLKEATMSPEEKIKAGAIEALQGSNYQERRVEVMRDNRVSSRDFNPNKFEVLVDGLDKPIFVDMVSTLSRFGSLSVDAFRKEIQSQL